ncbi:MAG: CcmD family protein [Chloroflexi bacterium]|nr:CcmD family protein [Chloroflexota bacterium]
MPYLFAAFMVIWVGLFAYMLYWQRQVRDLRAEVATLRELAAKDARQHLTPR